MIEKVLTESVPSVRTFVEVTPDLLKLAARKLECAKELAAPNQEIELEFTQSITLRWNPAVTTAGYNKRKNMDFATPTDPMTDDKIHELVRQDESDLNSPH